MGQAEQTGDPEVLVSTGEALSTIGERDASMQRFEKALAAPGSNRVAVRLAISKSHGAGGTVGRRPSPGRIGVNGSSRRRGYTARRRAVDRGSRRISWYARFRTGQSFFERALAAGAPETSVRIGLANTYLARGDTPRAEGQISPIKPSADAEQNYDYLLVKANIFRQEHHDAQALTAFAQAANAAGEDDTAQREMLQGAGTKD